jgi:hypothetical protein
MSPIGPGHAAADRRLTKLFSRRLGSVAIVSVQNPIALDDYSEPQPDVALLRPRTDEYAADHPAVQGQAASTRSSISASSGIVGSKSLKL